MNTLEEVVVFLALPLSSFLVGVVTQNLLTVGTLDLLGGCEPTELLETEDGVVVLFLLGISS